MKEGRHLEQPDPTLNSETRVAPENNNQDTGSWASLTKDLTNKAHAPIRACLLAAAIELFGAAQAEAQTPAKPNQLQHQVYIDPYWGHEFWLKWKNKHGLLVNNQNRIEPDGKSGFSYVGVGKEVVINKSLKLSGVVGPQYSFDKQKITHASAFANVSLNIDKLKINLINRFAIPVGDKARFIDRHIQSVEGIPGMPKNTGLQFEERRGPAGVDEVFLGGFYQQNVNGANVKIQAYADIAGAKKGGAIRILFTF